MVIIVLVAAITIYLSSHTFSQDPEDFSTVVNKPYFVDKTPLIKVLMEHDRHGFLITAPRRFGKSINMDMIKRFYEVEVDERGIAVPPNSSSNYKLFSTNNLTIFQDKEFFDKHFGRYPVIYLDFKRVKCFNHKRLLDSFRGIIFHMFFKSRYVLYNKDRYVAKRFRRFYEKLDKNTVNEDELISSVYYLTELLYIHFHNTRCIILIDEFDVPVQDAIRSMGSDFENIVEFINLFISDSLKSNSYVTKSLLTGCIRLSGLMTRHANNIIRIPFYSNSTFSGFYGLTGSEVSQLLFKLNMQNQSQAVKSWYDGYQVGDSKDTTLYNTYAISRYVETKTLSNYWIASGGVRGMMKLFTLQYIKKKIDDALKAFRSKTSGIQITFKYDITVEDVIILHKIINQENDYQITVGGADLFIQYLTEQGYFTIFHIGGNFARIRVPNKEIENELEKNMYTDTYFEILYKKDNYKEVKEISSLFNNLTESNCTYYELMKCISKLYSNHDLLPGSEYFLQHSLLFMFKVSGLFEIVDQGLHTAERKILDILLITENKTAIIIELKMIQKTAHEALNQILDKKYYDILQTEKFDFKLTIFIGLHINKYDKCTISYLYNSTDITKAVNLQIVL